MRKSVKRDVIYVKRDVIYVKRVTYAKKEGKSKNIHIGYLAIDTGCHKQLHRFFGEQFFLFICDVYHRAELQAAVLRE